MKDIHCEKCGLAKWLPGVADKLQKENDNLEQALKTISYIEGSADKIELIHQLDFARKTALEALDKTRKDL